MPWFTVTDRQRVSPDHTRWLGWWSFNPRDLALACTCAQQRRNRDPYIRLRDVQLLAPS